MSQKIKIRKGDQVAVIAGKDKGKKGEVIGVFPAQNRALVQGVNMVKRHERQSQQSKGGINAREAKVHISNLSLLDPKSGKPSKVGWKILKDGRKVRFARKSGEVIDG
ncbi:MAG: 50S ribosomal protein L24 [Parvibaculales bacterium]